MDTTQNLWWLYRICRCPLRTEDDASQLLLSQSEMTEFGSCRHETRNCSSSRGKMLMCVRVDDSSSHTPYCGRFLSKSFCPWNDAVFLLIHSQTSNSAELPESARVMLVRMESKSGASGWASHDGGIMPASIASCVVSVRTAQCFAVLEDSPVSSFLNESLSDR